MKKAVYIHLFLLLLVLAGCSPVRKGYLMICGGSEVRIVDPEESEGTNLKEVWKWHMDESKDVLPEEYVRYMDHVDECKLFERNRKLLITSSAGGLIILDVRTKEVLFHTYVPMAHSADMLPEDRVAVALSTDKGGNSLEVYDLDCNEKPIYRDSLYSGHGVVWNAKRQSLYALGGRELREYKLIDWKSENPSLEKVATWIIPVNYGHDLTAVDEDRLLLSGHEGVLWFDISKEEFSPFEPLKDTPHVKSVNYDPTTGRLVYTKAEIGWWTHNVYQENPEKTLTIDTIRVYKARPVK